MRKMTTPEKIKMYKVDKKNKKISLFSCNGKLQANIFIGDSDSPTHIVFISDRKSKKLEKYYKNKDYLIVTDIKVR